jgi:divalent metal cation (Fe/Co/Zn/Cd) transporter
MLNVYLFIELLGAANAGTVLDSIKALEIANCSVRNAVQLADDKLVAHVDCKTGDDATRAVLQKVMSVDGVVQTNIIAVVRPKDG